MNMPVKKRKRVELVLTPTEVKTLRGLIRSGTKKARTMTRARVLLLFHKRKSCLEIEDILEIDDTTARNICIRYEEGGLNHALYDAPRSGQPPHLTAEDKVKITAIACTQPPAGYSRWTLDLLEEEVTAQVKNVSRQTIYKVLLSSDLKPWREKNVVHSND